jgi:hypothetical protein
MFQDSSENNLDSVNKNIRLADIGLKNLGKTLINALNPKSAIENIATLNQEVSESVRTVLGQSGAVIDSMQESFANANVETLKYGIGLGENIKLFEALNTQMGRNTLLTSKQITSLNILAKNAGISSEQIGEIVKGFDTMGTGIQEATKNISEMERYGRSYGINVASFMEKIGKNIEKINAYNFEDGVQGLTRMIAKAQALRMNVDSTFQVAEKLYDPQAAIEFATNMQILGANVRGLTDPFELMYNAQNDVESLQDDMTDLLSSMVSFNEETGEFNISGAMRRQLAAVSKDLNMTTEEAINTAKMGAKRFQNLKLLEESRLDLSTEDKEFLANVAQITKSPGGSLGLSLKLGDELKDIKDLTTEELQTALSDIREVQDEANMSDIDIAKAQLGYLEDIAGSIASLGAIPTAELISQGNVDEYINNLTSGIAKQIDIATDFTQKYSEEKLGGQIDTFINWMVTTTQSGSEVLMDRIEDLIESQNLEDRLEILGNSLESLGIEIGDLIQGIDTYERILRESTYERININATYERLRLEGVNQDNSNDRSQNLPQQNPLSPSSNVNELNTTANNNQPVPVSLSVSGSISLDVNNLVTNYDLDVNQLGMEIVKKNDVMAAISKSINGDNRYGSGIITNVKIV